jgi:hypothetical protein
MKLLSCAVGIALVLLACDKPADSKKKDSHGHGHGHGHEHGEADDGVVARLTDAAGKDVGFVRLKLHDDKGDLELWLARDAKLTTPFDIPPETKITVTFADKGGRTVALRVRNRDKNEDEAGKPNVRDGKTNYFIFPGDSGEDASWLKGAGFMATVKVSFESDGKPFTTPAFVLRPHTHGPDHSH